MLSNNYQNSNENNEIKLWIGESQQGNVRAFELLYREYFKQLFLFCRRMTGSVSVGEEIVQDSFIKAWQALPEFRFESRFYTWLRAIASRLIIDRYRLKQEKIWQNTSDIAEQNFICQLNPQLTMDLEKMINLLPDGARSILVLHELEGYAHHEIAQMLGIAVGTSKAQLSRAKQLLRNNYKNNNYRNNNEINELLIKDSSL